MRFRINLRRNPLEVHLLSECSGKVLMAQDHKMRSLHSSCRKTNLTTTSSQVHPYRLQNSSWYQVVVRTMLVCFLMSVSPKICSLLLLDCLPCEVSSSWYPWKEGCIVLEGRGLDVATDPEDVKPSPHFRRSGRRVMRHPIQCARPSSTIDQIMDGTMTSGIISLALSPYTNRTCHLHRGSVVFPTPIRYLKRIMVAMLALMLR